MNLSKFCVACHTVYTDERDLQFNALSVQLDESCFTRQIFAIAFREGGGNSVQILADPEFVLRSSHHYTNTPRLPPYSELHYRKRCFREWFEGRYH